MTDSEYMTWLYDRAARRNGYKSHQEMRSADDASLSERMERLENERRADMEVWAKAQLSS
jgi:hypothetical protein